MVTTPALWRVTVVPVMEATLLSEPAKVTARPLVAVAVRVKALPRGLGVRGAKVMVWGAPLFTSIETLLVAVVYEIASPGVKVTLRLCPAPTPRSVPKPGVYAKVPATSAVALSWVADSAVSFLIAAGLLQVMTGVIRITSMVTLLVAVAYEVASSGVKVAVSV